MNPSLPKDPVMLLSVINMKLRDYYKDLSQLCDDMEISQEELCRILGQIDYQYDAGQNQFI